MDINEFIKNFADQFDDTDFGEFTPNTSFRDIDEWSSIVALAEMNMIGKKYGVTLKVDDLRKAKTIMDIFNLVQSKKDKRV